MEVLDMEELKKMALVTLGAASVSFEKLDKTIQELIEKGNLTVKQGKELREELMKKGEEAKPVTHKDVEEFIESLELVSREEFDELRERVRKLEER